MDKIHSFKPIDSITDPNEVINYPNEFVNSLNLPGLLPYNFQLKVGSVIIVLWNLNQPKLCDGTRLAVKKYEKFDWSYYNSRNVQKREMLIPRIPLMPTDFGFEFQRVQFPVRLAFAISINESQGQSLEVCGINLELPIFRTGSGM